MSAVHELSLATSVEMDVVALHKKLTKIKSVSAVDTTCPSDVKRLF